MIAAAEGRIRLTAFRLVAASDGDGGGSEPKRADAGVRHHRAWHRNAIPVIELLDAVGLPDRPSRRQRGGTRSGHRWRQHDLGFRHLRRGRLRRASGRRNRRDRARCRRRKDDWLPPAHAAAQITQCPPFDRGRRADRRHLRPALRYRLALDPLGCGASSRRPARRGPRRMSASARTSQCARDPGGAAAALPAVPGTVRRATTPAWRLCWATGRPIPTR